MPGHMKQYPVAIRDVHAVAQRVAARELGGAARGARRPLPNIADPPRHAPDVLRHMQHPQHSCNCCLNGGRVAAGNMPGAAYTAAEVG